MKKKSGFLPTTPTAACHRRLAGTEPRSSRGAPPGAGFSSAPLPQPGSCVAERRCPARSRCDANPGAGACACDATREQPAAPRAPAGLRAASRAAPAGGGRRLTGRNHLHADQNLLEEPRGTAAPKASGRENAGAPCTLTGRPGVPGTLFPRPANATPLRILRDPSLS